ncbi:AAA family ATPase [Mobilicoccus pelagius]|uniref:AAA family ATPase n=1 Tax=Mobilicoccus pelagius TaxID=746032 RepID=UPI0011479D3F|nr:AAA family ATPase [Mobilicoccus pelagius]
MSRSPSLPEPTPLGPSPVPPTVDAPPSTQVAGADVPAAGVAGEARDDVVAPAPTTYDERPQAPSGGFRDEIVADVVKGWRHELADLGGPNTLLWYRDLPAGTLDLTTVHPGGVSMLMAGGSTRLSHLVRERSAFVEARRRAHAIREKSLELREERGLVTCFMALGMATWDAPGPRAPQAPVLLRRCEIHPVDAAGSDFDLDLGTDVEVNPVLLNYLSFEQGIDLDPVALAALAAVSTRFDPMRVFRELSRVCSFLPGFTVHDRRVVSTFSYTKLPMVSDLTQQGMALGDHDVLAALAAVPGAPRLDAPVEDGPLDPGEELLALDADSTQSRAVLDVRRGRDIALVGGPGTGKSRTVANIVAALAAEGKSVLYVTSARRNLQAVTARLDEAGLSGFVLDAHGDLPDAQAVAREVVTALDRRRPAREPDTRGLREQLRDVSAEVDSALAAVHAPRAPWGVSVFEARGALAAQNELPDPPTSDVVLTPEVLAGVDADQVRVVGELLASVAAADGWSADWPADPWYRAWVVDEEEAAKARRLVEELAGGRLARARAALDATLVEAGLPPAETPDHWDGALDLMFGVRKTLQVLPEDVYLQPLDYLLGATADRQYRQERGLFISWRTRRDLRRRAESLLNPDTPVDQLHDVLSAAHEQRTAWIAWSGTDDPPRVPSTLDASRRLWDDLEADLRWLSERLETTAAGGDLFAVTVDELVARIDDLARHSDRIAVLPRVSAALDRALAAGFGAVVTDLATRHVPAARIPAEVERIWWRSLLHRIGTEDPRVGAHDGDRLRGLVDEYVRLDHDHLRASRDEVRLGVARRLHDAAEGHAREQQIVRYAASGTGAGVSATELFAQTHDLLLDVKPCWAMSPQVVASLVPVGRWFDVVVVDEAAQLLVSHAVSAISRARHVVVVGDDRQPAPLPYSTVSAQLGEEADPDESVPFAAGPTLLDAATDVLGVRRLTTVHAEVDESLLSFANHVVYDSTLVTTPGTRPTSPLQLVVAGRNEVESETEAGVLTVPGRDGDVMLDAPALESAEAATVIRLVREHLRQRPEESLLVVTLSSGRAEGIRAAMETAAELDTDLRAWLAGPGSDADRIVHVDRVVGARCDAVILALGYAPGHDGSLPRRFGRLEAEGGDRVLAAALAIATRRVTVVSEIAPEDFGDRRPSTPGAALLRDFLAHIELQHHRAEVAQQPGATDPAAPPAAATATSGETSLLLRGLAAALDEDDLEVHPRFGTGPRRVDLAVGEPDAPRPVVAVHLDGREHASITDIRDRERVRAELLNRAGWEVVRVWSADLLDDPAGAVPMIREGIRAVDARTVLRRRRTSGGHA